MSILKYAYLLDQDNYIVENKIFIDLMWHISKNKDNGKDKTKGINTKSYVIRNAGIMFQQIFYWHFQAVKNQRPTKYQYNNKGVSINVVKMDFEDWWEAIRLSDAEISSANKFLINTGLVKIYKMRIKAKDKNVFKPSNCYAINVELLEHYMDIIIDISKDMYKEKVEGVREKNIKSSMKHRSKLPTDDSVTLETQVTLNLQGFEDSNEALLTLSTESTDSKTPVTLETGVTKVTPETGVTIATLETGVTKEPLETGVANKSNTSFNTSFNTSSTDTRTALDLWDTCKHSLKESLNEVSYNTWIETGIVEVGYFDNTLELKSANEFTKGILETRYLNMINGIITSATGGRSINISIT